MQRIFIGFFFFLALTKISFSQTSFEFGMDTEEDCFVINSAIDNEGAVLLTGSIGTYDDHDFDAFILKIFDDGGYIENRLDMIDTVSMFSTIEVLENGNYFVIGFYSIEGNYFEMGHIWAAILDPELNLISSKSYKIREPYNSFLAASCSLFDNDGNVVLATSVKEVTDKEKTNFSDFAFYKFTPGGDTILSKYYSYIYDEWPWELKQMPNSENMMLIERCTHYNNHNELMFLSPDLDILQVNNWANENSMSSDVSSDFWLSDTSFLVSGYGSFDTTPPIVFTRVYHMDTSSTVHGELILDRPDTLDYPAWRNNMAYANDSTVYIVAFQNFLEFWPLQPSIVELYVIDREMNLLGYKELGGDVNYEAWGAIATNDDGCLIYGTSHTNGTEPERDVHIWKVLREDIDITTEVGEPKTFSNIIKVWPNPVSDIVNIQLGHPMDWDKLTLSIFTIDGKKVFQKRINGKGGLLKANLHNLGQGIYVMQATNGNKIIYSKKILKQ